MTVLRHRVLPVLLEGLKFVWFVELCFRIIDIYDLKCLRITLIFIYEPKCLRIILIFMILRHLKPRIK